jgi:hypothetical protein
MLGLIVEGHGEESAASLLIRRLASESLNCPCPPIRVHRVPKSRLLLAGELERSIELMSRQLGPGMPILVLVDADDACPSELASELVARSLVSHPHLNIGIVVAKREYEAWFLSSAGTLAGKFGLSQILVPPENPEDVIGAKEWLSRQMGSGRCYSPTRHQASFSAALSLDDARRCRSFRKLEKEVARLLSH